MFTQLYLFAPPVCELYERWMIMFSAYALMYRFILTNDVLLYDPISFNAA